MRSARKTCGMSKARAAGLVGSGHVTAVRRHCAAQCRQPVRTSDCCRATRKRGKTTPLRRLLKGRVSCTRPGRRILLLLLLLLLSSMPAALQLHRRPCAENLACYCYGFFFLQRAFVYYYYYCCCKYAARTCRLLSTFGAGARTYVVKIIMTAKNAIISFIRISYTSILIVGTLYPKLSYSLSIRSIVHHPQNGYFNHRAPLNF